MKMVLRLLGLALVAALMVPHLDAACCYFSAKNADILQPSQKVYITWEPDEKIETFTVQPKFEGNAHDFGMVIPTPTQPKLSEMPRDFFKHLAVYSIMKKREFPYSRLLPRPEPKFMAFGGAMPPGAIAPSAVMKDRPAVRVLESGVVGSLDYKIIEADRADDLYEWLKNHKYTYSGDEATLNHYIQKRWIFTVMKIDTMQMKRNADGSYAGEVTPTRFQFTSEKLVYPLKITQISVKDKTEALFYVQAPTKIDLEGDFSYQMTWIPMLKAGQSCTPGGLPGKGEDWLRAFGPQMPRLLARAQECGFNFMPGQRPQPGKGGHIATTMEWARKLNAADIKLIKGELPYGEKVPNVDEGFTQADIADPKKRDAIIRAIEDRLAKCQKERPFGYLVRHAPADDVKDLAKLSGHIREGRFITKFRKIFSRDEMNDDLNLIPARYNDATDESEYEELLPVSPP